MSGEPPSPWDLQRQLDRVELARSTDMERILKMHQEDRLEMTENINRIAERLERTIRETAGVPLGTWTAHNRAVDIEISRLSVRVEMLLKLVVAMFLTVVATGVGFMAFG